jgi:hypothetical protein
MSGPGELNVLSSPWIFDDTELSEEYGSTKVGMSEPEFEDEEEIREPQLEVDGQDIVGDMAQPNKIFFKRAQESSARDEQEPKPSNTRSVHALSRKRKAERPPDESDDEDKDVVPLPDKEKGRRKIQKAKAEGKNQPKLSDTKLDLTILKKRKAEDPSSMADEEVHAFWRGKTKAQIAQLLDPKRVPKVVQHILASQPVQWENMSLKRTEIEMKNMPIASKKKWLEDGEV